ncbi:hypothetical protein VRRI112168_00275 [Vreelandella rituensis]|uniref:Secreted protein n=1 Tax=Vreelandella rituensis TaxID=2282306 RepID=A0A368UB10_9GAMM|nr:hypothetical protein [Halomonas rituensis]RCV93866.1 hypothetical protein DU506_01530 [Halomonas rituensis]
MKANPLKAGLIGLALALGTSALLASTQVMAVEGGTSTGELDSAAQTGSGETASTNNVTFTRSDYVRLKDTSVDSCDGDAEQGYMGYAPGKGFALHVCFEDQWVPISTLQALPEETPELEEPTAGEGGTITFSYTFPSENGNSVKHGTPVAEAETTCANAPSQELLSQAIGHGNYTVTDYSSVFSLDGDHDIHGDNCGFKQTDCDCTWTVDYEA